jgi:hypothetical protein
MKKITYDLLMTVLDDEDTHVQEQGLLIVRHLLFKGPEDIEEVFNNIKARLLKKLEEKLYATNKDIIVQTLYVLCNISSGNDKHKAAVFDFVPKISAFLDSADNDIKQPGILILNNLVTFNELDKKINDTWNDLLYKLEKMVSEDDIEIEFKTYSMNVIAKIKNLKK